MRLFANLEDEQQRLLLSHSRVRPSEVPVIGSFPSSGNWLLLTTERLIWSVDHQNSDLEIENILDAIPDLDKLPPSEGKLQMKELLVLTSDGHKHRVVLESGGPLVGLWHVLKNIGTRNQNLSKDQP